METQLNVGDRVYRVFHPEDRGTVVALTDTYVTVAFDNGGTHSGPAAHGGYRLIADERDPMRAATEDETEVREDFAWLVNLGAEQALNTAGPKEYDVGPCIEYGSHRPERRHALTECPVEQAS